MTDGADPEAVATEHETVTCVVEEGIATVTIDRPDARNALNGPTREALQAVISACGDSTDVRVCVLTGSEETSAFVAGADVTELRERGVLEQRDASERPRVYETVAECDSPIIAAVNGHALGGGLELAMACDFRIAREGAKLGQPEVGLGIMPGGGGTQRLPRLVGPGQATKLILTGELVDASEAADLGLVEESHPEGDFEERVAELAEKVADQPPVAVERAVEAVRASERLPLSDGIDYEAELFVGLFATRDKNEGIDAFLEDRDPEWEGR